MLGNTPVGGGGGKDIIGQQRQLNSGTGKIEKMIMTCSDFQTRCKTIEAASSTFSATKQNLNTEKPIPKNHYE